MIITTLFRFMSVFLVMFNFWIGQELIAIGWIVLVQLDSINRKLPDCRKERDLKSEAAREEDLSDEDLAERAEQRRRERELEREKELASLFQASLDKQPKNS